MIIESGTILAEALAAIEKADIIAVDVETTGLNVRKDKVIGLGFSTQTASFYAHTTHHMEVVSQKLLGKKLIAWNAYFDLEMIRNNFGTDLWSSLHADVVCLKHMIEEEPPFSLKDVAAIKFGHSAKAEQEELKKSIKDNGGKPNEFFKADTKILAKYCIQDCKLTLRLYELYAGDLADQGLESFFYDEEVMPLYKEVTRFMMSRGFPVDVKKAEKLHNEISNDIEKLETQIQEMIKPDLTIFNEWFMNKDYPVSRTGNFAQAVLELANLPIKRLKSGKFTTAKMALEPFKHNRYVKYVRGDIFLTEAELESAREIMWRKTGEKYKFNPSSKYHLKKIFFDTYNEKPLTRTAKGAPQVNDEFLEEMGNKYQWVKLLQDYNKLNKLKGAYIERVLTQHEDGMFYPAFHQHRTISGRYGSDLQQLPRLAEDGEFSILVTGYRNQIRSLFTAKDGWKLVGADYESLEPHIFAHISNEDGIRAIFDKGDDFYSTIAIATEDIKNASANKKNINYLGKVDKKRRQDAKCYSLGIPYGMEDFALSKTLNISQERAKILINKYLKAYPNLKKWMEDSTNMVLSRGYVKSQAGRIRHLNKAQEILKKDKNILDSLYLYQEYGDDPDLYDEMKKKRSVVKNGLNNAKNFQIQSLAASITNRACIEFSRFLIKYNMDAYVCAQVHDEIVIHCKEEDSAFLANKLSSVMESQMKDILTVRLKAPAEIGERYSELK